MTLKNFTEALFSAWNIYSSMMDLVVSLLVSLCPIPMIPNFHLCICLLKGKLIASQSLEVCTQPRLNHSLFSISLGTMVDLGLDV